MQHSLFHTAKLDARMSVRCDDLLCLSDVDGLNHIESLLKSKYTAKDLGTLGFEDSDSKLLLFLNRVFKVGTNQTAQFLDIEPDIRHAPSSSTNLDATRTLRQ